MKKFKFIAAALVFAGATQMATAQSAESSSGATFGVKGGVNFATVTGDDFDSPDNRISFHVGLVGEVPISERFSLQGEVLYSGQGFETDVDGGLFGGDGKVEYQLDYLSVPVLAKVYLTDGLSIEVGPQFSFKVNEEIDADADADDGDLDLDAAEEFDFALAGGLTFQTQMGLFITGRYTYGLTDILPNADAKNSVFQVGLGFKF